MLKSLAVECGFCGGVFDLSSVHGNWAPVLDHNHATGVNRGFLHQVCNKTMGGLECIAKKRERSMYNVAMMAGRYEKNSRNGELILGDAA